MGHYEQAEVLLKIDGKPAQRDEARAEALTHAMLAIAEELQRINTRIRILLDRDDGP